MNASGLGRCEWKGEGQKEEMAGAWKETWEEEKERSCSLGQIFCCFIRFSVNQLVFARTGIRRGVLKMRAREERSRTGITSCPGAFTLQSSSVQTLWRQTDREEVSQRAGLSPKPHPAPRTLPRPGGLFQKLLLLAQRQGPGRLTFVIDLAVSVDVSLSDHLIHFLIGQLLTQVRHDVAQLCGADVAIAILGVRGQTKALSSRHSPGSSLGATVQELSSHPHSAGAGGLPEVAEQVGSGDGTGAWASWKF